MRRLSCGSHDLSAQDPYYILPIIMGATMFFIQKMSPTTVTDPMQQKIMTFMPVIFTVFFLWFPSGLVVYYIVSNLVTIIQQQLIYRGLEKRGLHSRERRNPDTLHSSSRRCVGFISSPQSLTTVSSGASLTCRLSAT